MEIERRQPQNEATNTATIGISASMPVAAAAAEEIVKPVNLKRLVLLLFNVILLLIGSVGIPLVMRVYFLHGGSRKWLISFLQTAFFPFLLVPLLFSFLLRRYLSKSSPARLFHLTPTLLLSSAGIGILNGIDNFLYSYGISYLPVSTASLLISTQLGVTAIFAYFIVRQRFTASIINSVVLLTFGAVVLGVHANGDRPEGESTTKYFVGFVMTLGAAVLYGLVMPLMELMYAKSKQAITYTILMEIQVVIGAAATVFCAVGMAVNKDFQVISRERQLYGLGETKYYVVLVFIGIVCQLFLLGIVGTIQYSSALLGGIIIACSLPITEVLAVFFFHEKFDGEKGVALALSLWGMASYFYGEYISYRQRETIAKKTRLPVSDPNSDTSGLS